MGTRAARPFPDEAALRCRSGIMALKGNIPSLASHSFRQALALNPFLWEAFEGLCAMCASYSPKSRFQPLTSQLPTAPIPTVDDIFPPHPPPIKRAPPEEFIVKAGPIATGVGFFTPDTGNAGNLFRPLKQEPPQRQPLRMGPPPPCVSLAD
jgi:anaphase-promoting complex subunit 3